MTANARVVEPRLDYFQEAWDRRDPLRVGLLDEFHSKAARRPDLRLAASNDEEEDPQADNDVPPEIDEDMEAHNFLMRAMHSEGLAAQNTVYAGRPVGPEIAEQTEDDNERNSRAGRRTGTLSYLIRMYNISAAHDIAERIAYLNAMADEAAREVAEHARNMELAMNDMNASGEFVFDANIALANLNQPYPGLDARQEAIKLLAARGIEIDETVDNQTLRRLLERERDKAEQERLEANRRFNEAQRLRDEAEERERQIREEAQKLEKQMKEVDAAVADNTLSPEEAEERLKDIYNQHSFAAIESYATSDEGLVDPNSQKALLSKLAPDNMTVEDLNKEYAGFGDELGEAAPLQQAQRTSVSPAKPF